MSALRCINCTIRVTRIRRHLLSRESEALIEVFRLWTYPREITDTDYVCHACWELGNAQASGANNVPNQERQVGHQNICVGCGRSVARLNSRTIIRENLTNDEGLIVDIISQWIHPRQLTSTDHACEACWLRAQRLQRRQQVVDEARGNEEVTTCVNCFEQLIATGHILANEDESLCHMINSWIYPDNVCPMDHICHACWQLAIEATQEDRETAETASQPLQADDHPILEPQDANYQDPTEYLPPTTNVQSHEFITLLTVRRAAASTRHCIFPNCSNIERYHFTDRVRSRVLQQYNYYIPSGARICNYHLNANMFHELYTSSNSYNRFTTTQIEDLIFILIDCQNTSNFNFDDVNTIPDHLLHYWIGFTKQQHYQILCESRLSNLRKGGLALTALLCKLRTGDSGNRLSMLFQVPRRSLETLMDIAREHLIMYFVPRHLGMEHISREDIIAKNSIIANGVFGDSESPFEEQHPILICDGTYIYTQKSSNYLFQKSTYSTHKYRNLVKPFMIVCCNGYILDVLGPFPATYNDAKIMSSWIEEPAVLEYFRDGVIFILDRGFRECINTIQDLGFEAHMPETVSQGHSQLTTLEGNISRCVTINRWVVEAVNGRVKRDFKIFRHEYFNRAGAHLMKNFKIAAALINAFATQFTDSIHAEEIVNIIHDRLFLSNTLANIVTTHNLHRRNAYFQDIISANLSFPRLSMEDLVLFACGTYQIRQARSYIGEHFRFHGVYVTEVCRDDVVDLSHLDGEAPILIRAKIKSRHYSRKIYFVFIALDRTQEGRRAIIGYCCNCIVGLRTIGCCSHVMSILWYYGHARYLDSISPPAQVLDRILVRLND